MAGGLPVLEQAERTLGPCSASRPLRLLHRATACQSRQLRSALSELERAEEQYKLVLDPETQYELWRLRGWILFYLGDLEQSAAWFRKAIRLARELADPSAEIDPTHWLGRIERNSVCGGQRSMPIIISNDRSLSTMQRTTSMSRKIAGRVPFNIFRKAQTVQLTGDVDAARKIATRHATYLVKMAAVNTTLRLKMHAGNCSTATSSQPNAWRMTRFEGWSDLYYAGGMSGASCFGAR